MTDTLKIVDHDAGHNLYQRLNAVMRKVGYVQKDKNVDSKYNVATYDAMLEVVRDVLIEHGVVVETRLVEGHAVETGGVSAKGAKWTRYEGVYEVRFINIDSPQDFSNILVSAFAEDMGDKGPGKAQTYATKAAIKKQLLLRTGEDEEERVTKVDTETGEVTTERQRPAAKAAPKEAAKPAANGKVASAGEIAFAKTKLGSDENITAFCAHLGIASIDRLPDGAGRQASKFVASRP